MGRLLVAALLLASVGCISSTDRISAVDGSSFSGLIRITRMKRPEVREEKDPKPDEGPGDPDTGKETVGEVGGEFSLDVFQADDDEFLPPPVGKDNTWKLDGRRLQGPAEVDIDITAYRLMAMAGGRSWKNGWFGFEGYVGAAFQGVTTRLESPTASTGAKDWYLGPAGAVQLNALLTDPLMVYGRGTLHVGAGYPERSLVGGRFDLEGGLKGEVSENVFFFVGYRWMGLRMERVHETDLDLKTTGFFLGLGVQY